MGKQQRNKQFESSVNELGKRTVADILLASVLLCCAGVFIFFFIKAPQGLKDVDSYYKMTLVFGGADIVVSGGNLIVGGSPCNALVGGAVRRHGRGQLFCFAGGDRQ